MIDRDYFVWKIKSNQQAIELEQLVLNHLQPDVDKLLANQECEIQRVHQASDSRHSIERWQKELEAWELALALYDAEQLRKSNH